MRLTGTPKGKIEQWGELYSTGRIVGVLEDGRSIITSKVVDVDVAKSLVLTKSGSIYELGEPCEVRR